MSSVQVPLTQGKFATIDEEDLPLTEPFRWYAKRNRHYCYAATNIHLPNGKRTTLRMHRLIMDALPEEDVDHCNGDTLNNRRFNLRKCTNAQNSYNQSPPADTKSGFKGVHPAKNKWRAYINCLGRREYLGLHATPQDAARAYDRRARELFGEFARLNFPIEGENGLRSERTG